jgi:hypothetical protein
MILGSGELAVFSYEMDLLTKVKLECEKKGNNMKHCLDFDYFEKDPFSSSRKIKTGFFVFLFKTQIYKEWNRDNIKQQREADNKKDVKVAQKFFSATQIKNIANKLDK